MDVLNGIREFPAPKRVNCCCFRCGDTRVNLQLWIIVMSLCPTLISLSRRLNLNPVHGFSLFLFSSGNF